MDTIFKDYLTLSEEEQNISSAIKTENAYFESTPEYTLHKSLIDDLYNKLSESRKKRCNKRSRIHNHEKSYTVEEIAGIVKKHNDDKLAQTSDDVRQIVSLYKNLSDSEKRTFHDITRLYSPSELDDMNNVKSTAQDKKDLLTILVNTCIDFINERNLDDIDEVHFKVDGLQDSREFGEWTPSTDAFVNLIGVEKDDSDFYVRKNINI